MRPWFVRGARVALVVTAVLAAASAAAADSVRTAAGIGHRGRIVGLEDGELVVESGSVTRRVPLAEIARVSVDAYPDMDRAESALARAQAGGAGSADAFGDAEGRYESLLRLGIPSWLRTVIQTRLYRVYAASGRTEKALAAYLGMAKSSPVLVEGLRLPPPRQGADAANRSMLKDVEAALAGADEEPHAKELRRFRVALVLLVGKPAEVLPLLDPLIQSPNEKTRRWATLKRVELLVALEQIAEAESCLAEAEGALPKEYAADVAYWQGRLLAARGRHIEAALALMRVPILHADRDREQTADALHRAGQSLEAAGVPQEEFVAVYKEAARSYVGTAGAERARRELARLGSG